MPIRAGKGTDSVSDKNGAERVRENSSGLSWAQLRALRWLARQGGEFVLDRYGRALAGGDLNGTAPQTWLRLVISGHVGPSSPHHLGLTPKGREALG